MDPLGLHADGREVLEVYRALGHDDGGDVHVPQDQPGLPDDVSPHVAQVDQCDLELLYPLDLDGFQSHALAVDDVGCVRDTFLS